MMRAFRILMSILVLACLAPLFSMVAAQVVSPHIWLQPRVWRRPSPAWLSGTDIGQTLMTMGMMGWFLMTTLPVMLGVVVLWIIVEIVRWFSVRRA